MGFLRLPKESQMEIPHYPASRPIEMADKPILDALFVRLQPRISEFTFANLYLFRKAHSYRLSMVGDALVVHGQGYDGVPYFLPPLGDGANASSGWLLDAGMILYGADESFVGAYYQSEAVEIVEDRDSFDYLYLRHELAELPGNRYHKKKNRINYFFSRHECQVELYTDRLRDGCLELLEEWRRVRGKIGSDSLALEAEAAAEALNMAIPLCLAGVVALVDGKVKAFALGEKLNNDTSVCHFEKADPFLEGLYQLIDREFCRLLFTDCTYVNREQDLGEQNLRQTKLSYHPLELVRKFRMRRRT
jgi:hypothetical protein